MTIKWTHKRSDGAPAWESKDGNWRIVRWGEHSGWKGSSVYWRINRWDGVNYKWVPAAIGGRHTTLAKAKAAVEAYVASS